MSKQQIPGEHPAQRGGCSAGGWRRWSQLTMEARPLRASCRVAHEILMEILCLRQTLRVWPPSLL